MPTGWQGQSCVLDAALGVAPAEVDVKLGRNVHMAEAEMDVGAALAGMACATVDEADEFPAVGQLDFRDSTYCRAGRDLR